MYKTGNSGTIQRLSDGASIPADESNTDYAAYLVWLSEGNTPQPADAAPVPPFSVQRDELLAAFRADRERMVSRLDMIANKAFRAGDPGKAAVCDTLTDALVDITTHPTVTAAVDMAALELAMETLYDAAVYAAITNPAAPTLLSDFERMDA